MGNMGTMAKQVGIVALGVIVAGLILYWGNENDIDLFEKAGKGFDY